jgi:hypothetical protein
MKDYYHGIKEYLKLPIEINHPHDEWVEFVHDKII